MAILKRFLFQRSLRKQWLLTSILLIAAVIGASTLIGLQRLNNKIQSEIDSATFWSLRVAATMMYDHVSIFQTERNAAGEPELLRFNGTEQLLDNLSAVELTRLVDAISQVNKGTATIFRWNEEKKDFVRVATTVKKPDGSRATGTVLGQNGVVYPYMMRQQPYRGVATILGEPYQTGYLPMVNKDGKPVGVLYIGVGKLAELSAAAGQFIIDMAIGSLVVLAVAMALLFFMTNRLLRPLVEVSKATDALASGSQGVEVPHRDRPDQIGTIARAVEDFREAVVKQREMEVHQSAEARRLAERKAEMDAIVAQFRQAIACNFETLREGAEKVRATSADIRAVVSAAAEQVGAGNEAAHAGAEAISEVATATSQFAGSIAEIANRSTDAATIVRRAAENGHRAETVAGELSSVVERISHAVSMISSIASQTNLLALNATIEAARAGDAGRGFAVVASEVKELSQGTSKAAAEIAELVKSIEGVTQAVTHATREIGDGLSAINETTMVIASAVTEQEQVTRGIADNAGSASAKSDTIRIGFADVHKAIEETAIAADGLDSLSHEFMRSSDALIGEFEVFLQKMAA